MKNPCVLFLAIFASFYPADALAGAWLQNKGEGQSISTLRVYATNTSFDANGNYIKGELFVKTDISTYLEYGLTDYLTIGGEIDAAATLNESSEYRDALDYNLSYGTIFARSYLYKGEKNIWSVEPGITFPRKIGNDLVSDGEDPIPELKLSYGYAFDLNDQYHFLDNSIKYRFRSDGELDDMIKAETVFGIRFTRDYRLLVQLTYEKSLGDVEDGVTGNYELLRPQLSVLHDHGYGITSQLGIFANVYGQNTGNGGGMLYSLWFNF